MARTERGRRAAVAAVLLISSVAMIATTPGEPTARADTEGDVAVGPDAPSEIVVRYEIPADLAREIAAIRVRFLVGGSSDPRLMVTTAAEIEGDTTAGSHGQIEVEPRLCRVGCTVDAIARLEWIGPREDEVRLGWESELEVVYENRVPSSAVAAAIIDGETPPIPRVAWFLVGLLLAAGAAVGWIIAGDRLRRTRLVLAAVILVPGAWVAASVVASLLPGSTIYFGGAEELAYGIGALALCVGVIVGVVEAWRGRPTFLRIAGWLGVAVVGFITWLVVMALPTYRPHEVVLLTLVLGLPVGAAVTADGLGAPSIARVRGVRAPTAIVAAAQFILIALLAGVCAYLAVGVVFGLAMSSGLRLDLGSVVIGLAPFAVLVAHAMALREWWRGRRMPLALANLPEAFVVIAGGVWVLVQPEEDAFLAMSLEIKVFAAIGILVVLIAAIGAAVVTPPGMAMPPHAPPADPRPPEAPPPDARSPDAPPSESPLREVPPPA